LVAELTWPEVKAYLEQGYLAVLPIGAACKEHGHHLPLNTDYIQAEWLAQQTALFCPSLIYPIISYGFYPTFVEYPGSCSLSEETFSQCVHDILQNILQSGANKIMILNTGISTVRPLENVLDELNQNKKIILFNAYSGLNFTNAVNEIEEQSIGGHADEIETSIILVIAPNKVDMTKAKNFDAELVAGPLNPNDPDTPNYSPYGVIGDARLATIKKGEILTNALVMDLAELIKNNLKMK
jgi:creatinine amidohydrolase